MLPPVKIKRIFVGMFFLGVIPLTAATPVMWDSPAEKIEVGKHFSYFEDTAKNKSISQIAAPEFQSRFTDSAADTLNFGQTNHDYWLKVTFERKSDAPRSRVLEIDQSNIDIVEFYVPVGGGKFEVQAAGMLYPFDARQIKNRNFVFAIELAPGEQMRTASMK